MIPIQASSTQLQEIFQQQCERAVHVNQLGISERKEKLKRLLSTVLAWKERIEEAIHTDFGKPSYETDLNEIFVVTSEIRHTLRHLSDWAAPQSVSRPLFLPTAKGKIIYRPKGTVLIISPWNFPFNLAMGPLISAIAAGNTVILKPSELTPATSKLLQELLSEVFEESEVAVVQGDKDVAQTLLSFPFHHIFFTGSPQVGKIVMKAASKHLTGVTLELGGKSPVIIDKDADLKHAAKRIAWGKCMNAGQTCIAPDYVLVHEEVKESFIEKLVQEIDRSYGKNITEQSKDYCKIISKEHHERLESALDQAEMQGARIVYGGKANRDERFLQPTLITDVPEKCTLLQDEIFGPILPIRTFSNSDEVISYISEKTRPLALYIFSGSKQTQNMYLDRLISGSVAVNDVVLQFSHPNLPFGGINTSGIGNAHGYYGFRAFSHEQSYLNHSTKLNPMYAFYPPYRPKLKSLINVLLRWF